MSQTNPPSPQPQPGENPAALTRRAFGVLGAGAMAALGGWWWLRSQTDDEGIAWPLRLGHRVNEQLGRALFSPRNLAPEFPPEAITPEPRANGGIGRPERPGTTVRVTIPDTPEREYSIAGLLEGVPRSEHITEFKCIEGWSQVVHWGGVRLADVATHHGWPVDRFAYLGLATQDGGYYIGLDMPSALHPQTLLCDQMNGEPLLMKHGAPLRLILPVKYGIKNIKWISRIFFADEPPADYWAERGYDWYAGL